MYVLKNRFKFTANNFILLFIYHFPLKNSWLYFTDSKVVWDELYDPQGNYNGYMVEEDFGKRDYQKEYFRGIQNLKDTKLSERTLFRLNKTNSPYLINEPDLIEVIMENEKSNGDAVKGMSTFDFLDYAILISNSKESIPIFEMK